MSESPDIPADLPSIAARAEAATPGPWWHQVTTACYDVIEGGERTSDSCYIAMMGTDYDGHDSRDAPNCRADAEFIVHARQDIPTLLAALDLSETHARTSDETVDDLRAALAERDAEIADLKYQLNATEAALGDARRENAWNTPM